MASSTQYCRIRCIGVPDVTSDRTKLRLSQLKDAVERLGESLAENETEFMRDSIIKRFEIAFELAWHALQELLHEEGIDANSPTRAAQAAFQLGWIEDQKGWSEMLENRNLTVHVYEKSVAIQVSAYVRAKGHMLLQQLVAKIVPQ